MVVLRLLARMDIDLALMFGTRVRVVTRRGQ